MSILSFLAFCGFRNAGAASHDGEKLVIDLATFQVGVTKLGEVPSTSDLFSAALTKGDTFAPPDQGIELGTKDNVLDYAFVTLEKFKGSFKVTGQPIRLDSSTREHEIVQTFGQPYWIDRSGGEVIYFYEYQKGAVELQFEFPRGKNLGFITLSRYGVLSDPEQRKQYGVNKPWPPSTGEQVGALKP